MYRDKTDRLRDIRPGDTSVESIYDCIHHEDTRFIYGSVQIEKNKNIEFVDGKPVGKVLEQDAISRNLWYSKADSLEDEVLFPEELSQDGHDPSSIGNFEPVTKWMDNGLPLKKFVENRMFDSDSDYETDSNPDFIKNMVDYSDEDNGEYSQDESNDSESVIIDIKRIDLSGIHPIHNVDQIIEEITKGQSYKNNMELLNFLLKKGSKKRPLRNPGDQEVIEEDFFAYLDKEKAKGKVHRDIHYF